MRSALRRHQPPGASPLVLQRHPRQQGPLRRVSPPTERTADVMARRPRPEPVAPSGSWQLGPERQRPSQSRPKAAPSGDPPPQPRSPLHNRRHRHSHPPHQQPPVQDRRRTTPRPNPRPAPGPRPPRPRRPRQHRRTPTRTDHQPRAHRPSTRPPNPQENPRTGGSGVSYVLRQDSVRKGGLEPPRP